MDTKEKIQQQVNSDDIVLYMKGTPQFPQCGFSGRTVQILEACGVKFTSFDVLADPEVRQGIKDFSNWPTVPQLYVKGKFIGGCDIMTDLYQKGELQKLISDSQS